VSKTRQRRTGSGDPRRPEPATPAPEVPSPSDSAPPARAAGSSLPGLARIHVLREDTGDEPSPAPEGSSLRSGFGGAAAELNDTARPARLERSPTPPAAAVAAASGLRQTTPPEGVRASPAPPSEGDAHHPESPSTDLEAILVQDGAVATGAAPDAGPTSPTSAPELPELLAAGGSAEEGAVAAPAVAVPAVVRDDRPAPSPVTAVTPPPSGGLVRSSASPSGPLIFAAIQGSGRLGTPYPPPLRLASAGAACREAGRRTESGRSGLLDYQAAWPPPGPEGSGLPLFSSPRAATPATAAGRSPSGQLLLPGDPAADRTRTPFRGPGGGEGSGRLVFFLLGLLVGAFVVLTVVDLQSLREGRSGPTSRTRVETLPPAVVVTPLVAAVPSLALPGDGPAEPTSEPSDPPAAPAPGSVSPAPTASSVAGFLVAGPGGGPPAVLPRDVPTKQVAAAQPPTGLRPVPPRPPARTAPVTPRRPASPELRAPAAGPGTGTLVIESAAPVAPSLRLDGQPIGRPPLRLQVSVGLHELTVLPEQGNPYQSMVRVEAGSDAVIRLPAPPATNE